MNTKIETYFVKDGLLNGEQGIYATTAGFGVQQKDGWYYLPPDADDGVGPYPTQAEAQESGEWASVMDQYPDNP